MSIVAQVWCRECGARYLMHERWCPKVERGKLLRGEPLEPEDPPIEEDRDF